MSFQQKKQKDGVNKQMTFAFNIKAENKTLEPNKINKTLSLDINQTKSEQIQKSYQQNLNSNLGSFKHIHHNHHKDHKDEKQIQQKQSKLKLIAYKSTPGLKPYTKAMKENQDSLLVKQSINNWDEWDLFLLADGHGLFGSIISQFAIQNLSQSIEEQLRQINCEKSAEQDINQIIQKSFAQVQQNLKSNKNIDLEESGCTMNLILKIQNQLISANIGDTRSYYYQRNDKPDQIGPVSLKIKQMSVQHTPEKMNEAQRIINQGGKIEQDLKGFEKTGPLKVKQKHQEIKGVTVTRCFGDSLVNQVGVISDPDITKFEITQDGFLMLVTGPILEMIDIIDICRILTPITPPNSQAVLDNAVMQIIDEARNKAKLQPDLEDDYSVILVYIEMEKL